MERALAMARWVLAAAVRSLTGATLLWGLSSGLISLLPKVAFGVALGLLLRLLIVAPSEASHPAGFFEGTHEHLLTMTNYEREDYCVKADEALPPASQQDAVDKISGTLSPIQGWNGIAQWRLDFILEPLECNVFLPNWNDIELRFFVTPQGCGLGASCRSALLSPDHNPLTGHEEFRIMEVTISSIHLNRECSPSSTNCWRHVISHEVGHTLGLADPGGCAGSASVMHDMSYGCTTDELWPTSADMRTVESLIPVRGVGGGAKGFSWVPF